MVYCIKKKGTGAIYHGIKNGTPMFYYALFDDVKLYKHKKNAERVIKKLRAEESLEVIEYGC